MGQLPTFTHALASPQSCSGGSSKETNWLLGAVRIKWAESRELSRAALRSDRLPENALSLTTSMVSFHRPSRIFCDAVRTLPRSAAWLRKMVPISRPLSSRTSSLSDRPSKSNPNPRGSAAASISSCQDLSIASRSEEHTSELQSRRDLVCRLLLEKK